MDALIPENYTSQIDGERRALARRNGWKPARFPIGLPQPYTASSESQLRNALFMVAENGSGSVRLTGDIEATRPLRIPKNCAVYGDEHRISARHGSNIVEIEGVENVLLIDLDLDGNGDAERGVFVHKARNVALVSVFAHHVQGEAFRVRHSAEYTLYACQGHNAGEHGFGGKDVFGADNMSYDEIAADVGNVGPGSVLGEDFLFLDCSFYNCDTYGLDTHQTHGQIVNCDIANTRYGLKLPDALDVLVYDCIVHDNDNGIKIDSTHGAHSPAALFFWRNRIPAFRIKENAWACASHNQYHRGQTFAYQIGEHGEDGDKSRLYTILGAPEFGSPDLSYDAALANDMVAFMVANAIVTEEPEEPIEPTLTEQQVRAIVRDELRTIITKCAEIGV